MICNKIFRECRVPLNDGPSCGIHVESTGDAAIVNNILTEEKGLTEGNTRTDALSGQGSREAIYGRPLFGRNFRLMLNREWQ